MTLLKSSFTIEEQVSNLTTQLSDLKSRARVVNYKNAIPKLPKNPNSTTLTGFKKRLSNWKKGLLSIESERLHESITNDSNVLYNYVKR